MPSATDVQYGPTEDHLLDWYAPASPVTCCVLLIHGGAWSGTGRAVYKDTYDTIDDLNAAGITAVTMDYTFADIGAQVVDIGLAVDWIKANLGYTKIVLWGDSAGGHLALLAAIDNNRKGVFGVVANSAPCDLLTVRGDVLTPEIMNTVVRAEPNAEPDRWRRFSPMRRTRQLAGLAVVYLIADYETDSLVPEPTQGGRFARLLEADGAAVFHLVVPGAGHAHMPEAFGPAVSIVYALAAA